jgi:hypothetical protein
MNLRRPCLAGLFAAASALAPFAAAQTPLPPTHFTFGPTEIFGYADLDGDGRLDAIVIDRASGAMRLGFHLDASGALTWTPPRASGVYDITGVTAGRIFSAGRDALALTAPTAGRVNLVAIGGPNTSPNIQGWLTPAIGPVALAASQIAGTTALEDFLLTSRFNGSVEHRAQLFVNAGAPAYTAGTVLHEGSTRTYDRAQRVVLRAGLPPQVAFVEASATARSVRVRALNQSGTPELISLGGLAAHGQYLLNPFAGVDGEFVAWNPGHPDYLSQVITFANGTYSASASSTYSTPWPLGQAVSVPAGVAAHLLLIAADGSQALVRASPSGADVQTLTPPPGENFTGAAAVLGGANGFQLLSGPQGPAGRSTTARSYHFNAASGTYGLVHTASLAPVADTSGAGHVLVYAGEPFVAPTATVLSRLRALDWSSAPTLGATIGATGEVFANPSAGLTLPTAVNLGSPPPGATHVLASQLAPQISVFALSPAEGGTVGSVRPTPLPGTFSAAVAVSLKGPPGYNVFYRTQTASAWQLYTQPVWLHRDTRFQAFAVGPGDARTPVLDVWYRFTVPAGQLSTLDDGIPDYVKIGLGFDPTQLPDREGSANPGEALNYLQIILDGAGVHRANTSGTALTLHVRPLSHDGSAAMDTPTLVGGFALPDGSLNPGNFVAVRDVSGEPLDGAIASHWGFFGAGQTAARLTRVGRAGRATLAVATTDSAFALDLTPPFDPGTFFLGRELAGLFVVPPGGSAPFHHPYGGGTDAAEAAAWKAAAIAHYTNALPPQIGVSVDPLETTLLLTFEQWLARRLVARGVLPATYWPQPTGAMPANRVTLTPFRPSEPAAPIPDDSPASGLVLISPEQLSDLERYVSALDPGHDLPHVLQQQRDALRQSADPGLAALRAVTAEVYRISARWAGLFPGAFPNPLDALREFLATGQMPRAYTNDWEDGLPSAIGPSLTALTPADYALAMQGLATLLALPDPRPLVTRTLVVEENSAQLHCTVLARLDTTGLVALVDPDGAPFRFPGNFRLVPGTLVQVTGYADAPSNPCAPETLEVVRAGDSFLAFVTGIPSPAGNDADGNLLDDDWELLFLGSTGNDPFAQLAGDGYTLLQIFLDGTDPLDPASYTTVAVANLAPPAVQIAPLADGSVKLSWKWPAQYAGQIGFELQTNTTLLGPWNSTPATVQHDGAGNFELNAPVAPEATRLFWRLALKLK